jgi:transcription elongation GreA/GreB family factor
MQGSGPDVEPGRRGSSTEPVTTPARRRVGALVEERSTVRVRDADGEEDYTLVQSSEADVTRGLISVASPVGRALLGCRPGDVIDVRTPSGMRRLIVVEVCSAGIGSTDRARRGEGP